MRKYLKGILSESIKPYSGFQYSFKLDDLMAEFPIQRQLPNSIK